MSAQETSDIELVQAIAGSDREALAALYDRHAPRLLGLARRLMGHPIDAEDLLHDLFIEVWHQAHRFDAQRGSVTTWLTLRLRCRAIDRLRSPHYRRLVAMGNSLPEPPSDISLESIGRLDSDPLTGAMQRAISELPAETQTILDLVYFRGQSLAEVAAELAMPLGTVKSRLHRALRTLRDVLADPDPEGRGT